MTIMMTMMASHNTAGPRFEKKITSNSMLFVTVLVSQFQKGWFWNHIPRSAGENDKKWPKLAKKGNILGEAIDESRVVIFVRERRWSICGCSSRVAPTLPSTGLPAKQAPPNPTSIAVSDRREPQPRCGRIPDRTLGEGGLFWGQVEQVSLQLTLWWHTAEKIELWRFVWTVSTRLSIMSWRCQAGGGELSMQSTLTLSCEHVKFGDHAAHLIGNPPWVESSKTLQIMMRLGTFKLED